ncbi:unknown [Acidiphilium sp. CAG:727]|nr:unknown [Acidiphilium sp. CAG:727]
MKIITSCFRSSSLITIRLQNDSNGYQPVVTPISSSASAIVTPLPFTIASALGAASVDCGTAICAVTSYPLSLLSKPKAITIAVFSISISPKLFVRNRISVNAIAIGKNFERKNFFIAFFSF